MNDSSPLSSPSTGQPRSPWNKGKIIGPRPPLRPAHVWSIRAKLHLELRVRDSALFNLAIDSKLRGCDLVALRVDDVAPHGYAVGSGEQCHGVARRRHSRQLPSHLNGYPHLPHVWKNSMEAWFSDTRGPTCANPIAERQHPHFRQRSSSSR